MVEDFRRPAPPWSPAMDDALVEKVDSLIVDMCNDGEESANIARAVITLIEAAAFERAAKVATGTFPRGSAHTYASENADVYRAQEYAAEFIAERIRSLTEKQNGADSEKPAALSS